MNSATWTSPACLWLPPYHSLCLVMNATTLCLKLPQCHHTMLCNISPPDKSLKPCLQHLFSVVSQFILIQLGCYNCSTLLFIKYWQYFIKHLRRCLELAAYMQRVPRRLVTPRVHPSQWCTPAASGAGESSIAHESFMNLLTRLCAA